MFAQIVILALALAQDAPPDPVSVGPELGGYLRDLPAESAGGVAILPDGRIVVVESNLDRLLIFETGAEPDTAPAATLEPPLRAPHEVAAGPGGRLYVADTGNDRIAVVDLDGTLIAEWGPFDTPLGIDVRNGRAYVAESGADRVHVVDPESGAVLLTVGERGSGPGQFRRPASVTADDEGNIFVADTDNHRIQKLDPEGSPLRAWGDFGTFPGLFTEPGGLAVHADELYVVDRLNHRVQVFGTDVTFRHQWGLHAVIPREGQGKIHYPTDIAVSPAGDLAVVTEPFEHRCQVFGPVTSDTETIGNAGGTPTGVQSDYGSLLSVDGKILAVWEPETRAISVYDTTREIPILITRFGEPGGRFGQFGRIAGLSVDGLDIHVADDANDRLDVYRLQLDPDARIRFDPFLARFVKSITFEALGAGRPGPLTRGAEGEILALNLAAAGSRVEMIGDDLESVSGWPTSGETPGHPTDLAIGVDGDVLFIADPWAGQVVAFEGDGAIRGRWDGADTPAPFRRPVAVAAGHDGFVYVVDAASDRVVKLDEQGAFQQQWGTRGVGMGELWQPAGIAQDERGRVYVLDYGNHRIQIFGSDGEWLVTFGLGRAYTKSRPPRPPRPAGE